ncbi:hypothetical protein [Kitasatospora sp. NPDC051914]|uniref:hypothetical protein n=1 Tax=Kitasatospora sp. NPDC051914 TaxID=3154945 RepID=UPI0034293C97
MHDIEWSRGLAMSADGTGQVGHVGGVHLRLLAERTGLTGALSAALARRGFHPVHDRGQVMVDLAVAITLGATCIRDVRLLEHQRPVFGPVASFPTVWRALKETGELALSRIERARAAVRRYVHALLRERPEGFPETEVDGVPLRGWMVIDSDGTLISALSDKQGARGTYKGTSATTCSSPRWTTPANSWPRCCTRAASAPTTRP